MIDRNQTHGDPSSVPIFSSDGGGRAQPTVQDLTTPVTARLVVRTLVVR
jgi:hypothetical protein